VDADQMLGWLSCCHGGQRAGSAVS